MTPGGRESGFTLLEMLVAVCVLALLSGAVARGLDVGAYGFFRARQAVAEAGQARETLRFLRDLVAGAAPEFTDGNPVDRRIAFSGTADALAFVTRCPPRLGPPVMIDARLFLAEDGRLTLGWRLDLPRADGGGPLPEALSVIASHVSAIRFAYAGTDGWRTEWRGAGTLPRNVRLEIDSEGQSSWLIVAPRADAVPACTYAPTDIDCAKAP